MTPPGAGAAPLLAAISQVVRGKSEVVELAVVAFLAGGHLLLQDMPGVGKTTLAAALAAAVGGRFARVQFTSDLLPGDLTGGPVLGAEGPVFRPGPLFANVVLADEINRASPRTQSALFEAMAEHQITVDGVTRSLPRPFLVVATQNPFDGQGTYGLPESQLDRFLMRLSLGYPDRESERAVLRQPSRPAPPPVALDAAGLEGAVAQAAAVTLPAEVEDHLLDLVWATRRDSRLTRGASPRAAQALHRAARALAFVRGRRFVVPEDVRSLVLPVLAHRLATREGPGGEDVAEALRRVLTRVPAPV